MSAPTDEGLPQAGMSPTGHPIAPDTAPPVGTAETATSPTAAPPPPPGTAGDEQASPATWADALDALFRQARTAVRWTDKPVGDDTLHALYDHLRHGPTSANCSPARFAFLRTPDSKERLRPALSAGNVEKSLAAPVVAIVAHDPLFYDQLPRLFPHADARGWFAGNAALAEETAFRNGTLQGAYLILAARGLGLGTAPMSGFDGARVDEIFFGANGWRSNFLVALGHADLAGLYPRSPRLEFDEACLLL